MFIVSCEVEEHDSVVSILLSGSEVDRVSGAEPGPNCSVFPQWHVVALEGVR